MPADRTDSRLIIFSEKTSGSLTLYWLPNHAPAPLPCRRCAHLYARLQRALTRIERSVVVCDARDPTTIARLGSLRAAETVVAKHRGPDRARRRRRKCREEVDR